MRAKLLLTIVLCLTANVVHAATISVRLNDLTGGGAGIHTIGIYLQADAATSVYGISGTQIDIMSVGTGNAAFTGGASGTSFSGTNIASFGYSTIKAVAVDATNSNISTGAAKPQPVTGLNDGDIDGVGLSFSTTPGNVDPVNFGAIGQTGGFELVAKELWNVTGTETLRAWLTGAQYFTDGTGAHFADYDTAVQVSVNGGNGGLLITNFPEPGSVVLMGLGGLGLAAVARRRARKA